MRNFTLPAMVATVSMMFSAPVLADQAKSEKAPQTKTMSAPKDDHTFAMHMAHHHRDGIAMVDAVIANGTSDDVKTMARRIRADQQKDLAMLDKSMNHASHGKMAMPPKDPAMERGMAQLKAAKAAEADRLFLELMIAHHASALTMTHSAMPQLADASMKSMAQTMFAKQAREIGELQRLREGNRAAKK